jgi:CHAT domain-containing protein
MTGQALEKAQTIQAHDLLVQWEWQMGRLLKKEGKQKKAAAALRRAVYHFQTIRNNISMGDLGPSAFFRGIISSIHQDLADILLSMASSESREENRQTFLREARGTIEEGRLSELRDYFRDPCLAALSKGIRTISQDTAVLYPILLPDRVELLIEAGGTLLQKTSPIPRDRLEDQVRDLACRLRKGLAYKIQARRLYDGLIRPVESVLEANGIKTLVQVPDGVLRLIPLAALMDGDKFLVERYSLATAPGLTLLDPAPFGGKGKNALVAGISFPGPVIYDLPQRYWDYFGGRPLTTETVIRGLSLEEMNTDTRDDPGHQDRGSEGAGNRVRQALALPGVKQEIDRLSGRLSGKVLYNEAFGADAFFSELHSAPYSIIHIASHGFFGDRPEENFIMAFDRCLDMNFLEGLIRPKQLADNPVELISLSACQTAEGDEKSPLGLTGVVLKSGARSALGSLWPVSDMASQEIFPIFYSLLDDPHLSMTKAESLQKAQLSLLRQKAFEHPFYWSAFILVGNWL